MEFDETPRFWYPRIARDMWINFNTQTVELRPLERRKNSLFLPPPFSLFYSVSSPSFLFASPHFLFLFFLFSISFPPNILSFVCSHFLFSFSHFLISHFSLISLIFSLSFSPFTSLFLILIHRIFLFFFPFLSFFLIFLFLPFLFSISHLDCINRMVQKWGKLPPTFLHCHLSSPPFFS